MQEWENSIRSSDPGVRQQHKNYLSLVFLLLTSLYELALDPHAEVAAMATTIVDYIMAMLLESPFAKIQKSTVRAYPLVSNQQQRERVRKASTSSTLSRQSSASNLSSMAPSATSRPTAQRSDSATLVPTRSSLTETLKRTSSFASTIKSLASYANLGHASQPETASIPPSPAGSSVGDGERINSRPPSPAFNRSTYIPPYPQYSSLENESSEPGSSRASSCPPMASSIRSLSLHPLLPASPGQNANEKPHDQQITNPLATAFSPGDIVCALIGRDLLQFHQRKTRAELNAASRSRGRDSQRRALCDQIDLRKMEAVQATFSLDLTSGLANVLPLKSKFYDWCLEYYKEAQMRVCVPNCC